MIEQHVTSLELSKKLGELGYPQENSLFYWDDADGSIFTHDEAKEYINGKAIAAPIASELGKFLPSSICWESEHYTNLIIEKNGDAWEVKYEHTWAVFCASSYSLAKCFAEMLIWLVENDHLAFKKGE
jgi:hypothetical protein